MVPVGGLEPPRPKATDFEFVQEHHKNIKPLIFIILTFYHCDKMLSQWQKIVTVIYIIYLNINTCDHRLCGILAVAVKLKKHKPSAPQTDNFLVLRKP